MSAPPDRRAGRWPAGILVGSALPDRRSGRLAAGASALIVTAIAVADAVVGSEPVLIGALIVGPLIAGLRASPRATAAVAAYATVLAVVLGAPDDVFLTSEHLIRVLVVAAAAAFAIQAAIERHRHQQTVRLLAARNAVSAALATPEPLGPALRSVLEGIGRSFGWPLGNLWMVAPGGERLRLAESWHSGEADLGAFVEASRPVEFAPGEGLPGGAWKQGRPLWLADADDAQLGLPRAQAIAAAGLHGAFVFPVLAAAGPIGAIEYFAHAVRQPDRELLETVGALGLQIGESIERARSAAEVRRAEALRASVMDTALDCVIVMDHRGDVVEWNPAAEATFGWRRDEAVGACLADLIIPPALRERHHRGLERYLETGEGPVMDRRLELTGVRRDGSELPVELTIARIADTDPPVFTGYLRDITARTEAESERERILERERAERLRAERAERRTALLADAAQLIGGSLDLDEALAGVARVVVPRLADWCVIDTLAEDGSIQRLTVAYGDPEDAELAATLERSGPISPDAPAGTPKVIRTGEPDFIPELGDDALRSMARDEEHLEFMRRLGPSSSIVVPLRARGRILGALALLGSRRTGRRYDEDDLSLASTLAGRCALAIDNALLYRERSAIARTLQASLLPPILPPIPGVDLGARYLPGGEGVDVGGDFYDVFQTSEGAWAVVIGDVRGKGAGAAALTGLVRHTLRAAAVSERGPERILNVLNEAILRGEEGDDPFCTVVFACVEPSGDDLEVTLACAGHPLPLAVREDGSVEPVGRPGTLLGVVHRPEVSAQKTVLRPGDALVLYTDGVPEARSRAGLFGLDRLESLLSSCAGATAERIAERIEHEVRSFQDEGRRDDLAVLVLRVPPVRAGESPEDERDEPAPIGRP